jgi:hypothetical protein
MTPLLKALREAALAATEGPWKLNGFTLYAPRDPSKPISFYDNCLEVTELSARSDDEDYIALANPANILKLLDALEVARETLYEAVRMSNEDDYSASAYVVRASDAMTTISRLLGEEEAK